MRSAMNACIHDRNPQDMSLDQIERELAAYEALPLGKRTARDANRINMLHYARQQIRSPRLW